MKIITYKMCTFLHKEKGDYRIDKQNRESRYFEDTNIFIKKSLESLYGVEFVKDEDEFIKRKLSEKEGFKTTEKYLMEC